MVAQMLDSMVLSPIQEGGEKNSKYSEASTRAKKEHAT